jgi:predicted RNase H-like nuclease (RuvC/YqgF family)
LALQETIRQQEWKIERLTKDNRALEASNCELRAQLDALKEENLQVTAALDPVHAMPAEAAAPTWQHRTACMFVCALWQSHAIVQHA